MSITKKTEYAIRALYEISKSGNGKPVGRKHISQKQNISEHFLEQILICLHKGGITRSIKGPGGGFMLKKAKKDITVWDIYTVVEKTEHFYKKCEELNEKNCDLSDICKTKFIWPKINNAVRKSMEGITMLDIINGELETDNFAGRK